MLSLGCALGCGHYYPVGTTSPAADCVAVASGGRHRPARFFVGARQTDYAHVDAVVSADPAAHADADRGARRWTGAYAAMGAAMPMLIGGSAWLVGGKGDARFAGVALLGASVALEVTGALLMALDGHGQRALDRINQRARAEGRCPP